MSAADLDDLLAIEAAEDADRARNGDSDAGESLLDSLLHWPFAGRGVGSVQSVVDLREPYLRELRSALGLAADDGGTFLELLGLDRTGKSGRIPKAVRAEAARRLRAIVDLAREGGAPEPLLAFYSTAAGEIEAGAVPLRALGLKRRRGRPREPELPVAIAAAVAHGAIERAREVERLKRWKALELASATIARLTGRGSSAGSTANALRKYRPRRKS